MHLDGSFEGGQCSHICVWIVAFSLWEQTSKGSVAMGPELGSEGWREKVCVRGARLQVGVFW